MEIYLDYLYGQRKEVKCFEVAKEIECRADNG